MGNIIDISHHNSTIDWTEVAKTTEGVFLKCSQGTTYVDPLLISNANAAHDAGIPIGYYHFSTLNSSDIVSDAHMEANWFVENIKKCPAPTLPVVLDIETNEGKMSKDKVLLFIQTFFSQLEKMGYKDYLIYSYTPFLDANLPPTHNLGNIRLWVAAYSKTFKIPKGWSKVFLWQYSNEGHVNGIKTNVDLNKYV